MKTPTHLLIIILLALLIATTPSFVTIIALGRGEGIEAAGQAGINATTSDDALKGAFASVFTAGMINSIS